MLCSEWIVRIGSVYTIQMIIIVVRCNTWHTLHGILFLDKLNFYNQGAVFFIHTYIFIPPVL